MIDRSKFIAIALTFLITGCAAEQKPGTKEQLTQWCAKYENLPVYPEVEKITFPQAKGIDQCSFVIPAPFQDVNKWYVKALSNGAWERWQLFHDKTQHPDVEFYSLCKGPLELSISINSLDGGKKAAVNFSHSDGVWQRENYEMIHDEKK